MKESERIQAFLNQHKSLLEANHIDVAHSIVNDEWFIYCYEPVYGHYEYFIKFSTVEQLINIIIEEMSFMLRLFLDDELETPECEEDPELADRIERYHKEDRSIPELIACIDHILETDLGKDVDFFKALKNLIDYK